MHVHCPLGCEHPQPLEHEGTLYCAMCLMHDVQTECLPCTPQICEGEPNGK